MYVYNEIHKYSKDYNILPLPQNHRYSKIRHTFLFFLDYRVTWSSYHAIISILSWLSTIMLPLLYIILGISLKNKVSLKAVVYISFWNGGSTRIIKHPHLQTFEIRSCSWRIISIITLSNKQGKQLIKIPIPNSLVYVDGSSCRMQNL